MLYYMRYLFFFAYFFLECLDLQLREAFAQIARSRELCEALWLAVPGITAIGRKKGLVPELRCRSTWIRNRKVLI